MKKTFKIIGIGVLLGLVLLLIKIAFNIDEQTFFKFYIIFAIIILVISGLINLLYNLSYNKKIQKLLPLLDEDKTELYIESMTELLRKAKGNLLQQLLKVDLSAGYIEAHKYDEAIRLLLECDSSKFKNEILMLCYTINLCLCYFETDENAKALDLYQDSQTLFNKYSNSSFGKHIVILGIEADIATQSIESANEKLIQAKEKYTDKRTQKWLNLLSEKI